MIWYGMVQFGLVWFGLVWFGLVWYGMVWYGMVWYGMVWVRLGYTPNFIGLGPLESTFLGEVGWGVRWKTWK